MIVGVLYALIGVDLPPHPARILKGVSAGYIVGSDGYVVKHVIGPFIYR